MTDATADAVLARLHDLADPDKAAQSAYYFKTGPGDYGAQDVFLGIRMPVLRDLARSYSDLALEDLQLVLCSPLHEARMLALLVLVRQFKAARRDPGRRDALHAFYLAHTRYVNNWDLVDTTAPVLVGQHLPPEGRGLLDRLAASPSQWERRIAIVATLTYIRKGDFSDTFRIVEALIYDEEDLVHKACGWMLKEVGKRDEEALEAFLGQHYRRLPRTALRAAIEKLPNDRRQVYLSGDV